jgi:hypothetical protein
MVGYVKSMRQKKFEQERTFGSVAPIIERLRRGEPVSNRYIDNLFYWARLRDYVAIMVMRNVPDLGVKDSSRTTLLGDLLANPSKKVQIMALGIARSDPRPHYKEILSAHLRAEENNRAALDASDRETKLKTIGIRYVNPSS